MKTSARILTFGLLFAVALTSAFAAAPRRMIEIADPWARLPGETPNSAGIFFDIVNHGDATDTLLSASTPMAEKAWLGQGRWHGLDYKIEPVEGIAVRAGGRTTLAPGGLVIMLDNPVTPLTVGKSIPLTLMFQRAGRVEIEAVISNQLLGNRR